MAARRRSRRMRDERGFTLVEFLIAAAITTAVLGGAVMLASQLQQAYATQLDDTTVEEEVRFALDWIGQALRNAGSDPYSSGLTPLTITGDNQIRIQADINPPDGDIIDLNEDVTIAIDTVANVLTREDNNFDASAIVMSEPVITDLDFVYLDANRNVTANANQVAYVRVTVTGQSQSYNVFLGANAQRTLTTDVRVRIRP